MIVKERHNKENMTVTVFSDDGSQRVWHGFTEYVGQQFVKGQYLLVLFVEDTQELWVLESLASLDDFMRYWADGEQLPIRQYEIFSPFKTQE